MSGIVDWHTHWLSPRSLEFLRQRSQAPRIVRDDNGGLGFEVNSSVLVETLPIGPSFHDPATRLAHIEQAGVDHQVISWPTTLGVDAALDADEARALYTLYNDDLAELVREHPQRLSGLAVLSTADIEWSARELERAHGELGLIGAVLPAGAFLNLEGARRLAPLFAVAQRLGSHIYLHTGLAHPSIPGQWAHPPAPDATHARWLLESTSQFAAAWITLGLADFLDDYPDVSVQLAMLGGLLPTLLGIIEKQAPIERIRRLYVDSAILGTDPDTLALAVRHLGAERILFGSDYPLQSSTQVLQTLRAGRTERNTLNTLLGSGQVLLEQIRARQAR